MPMRAQLLYRRKSSAGERLLAAANLWLLKTKHVHDAEVHLAHRRRIVVDQAEALLLVFTLEIDFFRHLAEHGFAVGGLEKVLVIETDVAADADRAERLQPRLRGALSPRIVKNLVLPAQHHVRHDLLEARIGLHFGAQPIAEMSQLENARQVVGHARRKALEEPGLMKDRRGYDEDAFAGLVNHLVLLPCWSSRVPCRSCSTPPAGTAFAGETRAAESASC